MKDLDATFYAILEIWDELPRLIGSPYASLFPQLLAKLERIHAAAPEERETRVFELLDCLEPFPATWERIRAVRKNTERIRHNAEARGEVPLFDDEPSLYGRALRERWRPPKLVRHTDITAPRRLPVGERGVITVGLLEAPVGDSVSTQALELLFTRQVEVHLIAVSPALEVLNARVQKLEVQLGGGEPPRAVFFLRGETAGRKHLRIDFLQAGELLKSVPISIEVSTESASSEVSELAASKLETRGLDAPPCDLEFRVASAMEDGATHFHYTLHSPNGALDAFYLDVEGPEIVGSAEAFREQLFTSLEEMWADSSPDPVPRPTATAHRRLVGIGERIFDQLLPDAVKIFFDQHDVERIRTVQITSDEPWIPWELLRLRAPEPEDEAFWCEKYAVTRWLAGERTPARSLTVSRMVRIAVGREPEADGGFLFDFAKEAGTVTKELRSASLGDVEEALDLEAPDLWHVEASGLPSSDGRRTGIQLESGTLWPEDFDWQRRGRIAERQPLVFLNVAGGGRLGRWLTRLEGWAPLWVSQCGCGVFIAPISQIDDEIGRHFSRVFYRTLGRGVALGEAVREARCAARKKDALNPTWAVYSAYGHPNARIAFAAPQQEEP